MKVNMLVRSSQWCHLQHPAKNASLRCFVCLANPTVEIITTMRGIMLPTSLTPGSNLFYDERMTSLVQPGVEEPERNPALRALSDNPQMPALDSSEKGAARKASSPLVLLPSEILYIILCFLPSPSLAAMSATCRHLFKHTQSDFLWMNLVNSNLPKPLSDPAPFNTWKELYISQFPMWFVARNKIWFSDVIDTGKLIVTRYNPRKCMIEGYRVVAKHTFRQFETWSYDPEVLIHSFKPQVSLWMDDPVVQLFKFTRTPFKRSINWRHGEIRMPMALEAQRVFNNFILCAKMPHEDKEDPGKFVWPPRIIPSDERVDVSYKQDLSFKSTANVPHSYENICTSAFRVRRWAQLGNVGAVFDINNTRHGVSTFASLQPELYTPTPEKPYQGIWVGDYSGHGSEFLLVLQRDDPFEHSLGTKQQGAEGDSSGSIYSSLAGSSSQTPRGRLEAIKLTGDPNVPRGQITFFAEDIGPEGLIRIADEDLFKGARVVRSQGHIASTNFRDGEIPCDSFCLFSSYFNNFVAVHPFHILSCELSSSFPIKFLYTCNFVLIRIDFSSQTSSSLLSSSFSHTTVWPFSGKN